MREAQLRALVGGAGHKVTESRGAVLTSLAGRDSPFTASELIEEIARSAPEVGRATVFRTLDLLIGLGAAERVRLPGGQDGYVLCGLPHHHHVVCSSCGSVGEVEDRALEAAIASAVRETGFALQAHALELTGLCPPCSEARP